MLFGVLFFGALQLAGGCACFALARHRGGWGLPVATLLGAAGFFIFGLCAGSPALFYQWVALLIVGLACLIIRLGDRSFLAGSILASVCVVVITGLVLQPDYAELREDHPFESMSQRMAKRTREDARTGTSDDQPASAETISADTLTRLEAMEDRYEQDAQSDLFGGRMRAASLELVHASQVEQFINSEGFGIGRRRRPSVRYLTWDWQIRREPVLLDDKPAGPNETGRYDVFPQHRGTLPSEENLDDLHQDAQIDFANPGGYGYVRDREHVAGFVGHGFRGVPELQQPPRRPRWVTRRVELVSLLMHDEPMVYVSDHLPNMEALDDVDTRRLDAFEQEALPALRDGKETAWQARTNRIRLLGAVRAAQQCIECHAVRRGALLGAFSYILDRDPPLQEPDKRSGEAIF